MTDKEINIEFMSKAKSYNNLLSLNRNDLSI